MKNPWDDEDAEEQLKEEEKPKPAAALKPKTEKNKEKSKKVDDNDGVLSDPLAEKLRQQRYILYVETVVRLAFSFGSEAG